AAPGGSDRADAVLAAGERSTVLPRRRLLNQRSGDFEPHLELLRPDGRWISRSSTNGTLIYDSERLPETGWYTVLVRDRGTGLNTGVYDIALDYGSSTRPR
ncbi:MAG TPA: hypothetical protein VFZ00_03355, partial [Solirubrobacter sp.]|nr:hypothetical protein [Solirubrobacter sp.]